MNIVYAYLIIINIITFILFGFDKKLAVKHKSRISERTLILLSILGGCFLEFIAMFIFRHKTLKVKFYVVNIIFIMLYIIFFYLLYR